VAILSQSLDQMSSDESRASRNEYFHFPFSLHASGAPLGIGKLLGAPVPVWGLQSL
jgi:hypothetical protein